MVRMIPYIGSGSEPVGLNIQMDSGRTLERSYEGEVIIVASVFHDLLCNLVSE